MSSTCQPYLGRETTELGLERLRTILVHRGRCSMKQALGLILLHERHRTGDGVANVDRSDIVKVHLRSQKADQAANMGHHATGEQTRGLCCKNDGAMVSSARERERNYRVASAKACWRRMARREQKKGSSLPQTSSTGRRKSEKARAASRVSRLEAARRRRVIS